MQYSLLKYSIHHQEFFNNEEFKDTSELKIYLNKDLNSQVQSREDFDSVYHIVEAINQLRFAAEEQYKIHPYCAYDRRKELPLAWDHICNEFTSTSHEPPRRIISSIAQEHLPLLEKLLTNLRKVLRRKREMVTVSSVQQIDGHCLRWLTKQPGITPAQKAGMKQKILGIIREESYDTLENRMLKDFLLKCINHSTKYIQQYDIEEYKNSQRIKDVHRLCSICNSSMMLPEIQSITHLKEIPIPNYVMQYDPLYSRIWNLYQQLIRQTKLTELLWSKRHMLFAEYANLQIGLFLRESLGAISIFNSKIWFLNTPDKSTFVVNPSYNNVYEVNAKILEHHYFTDIKYNEIIEKETYADFYLKHIGANHAVFSFIFIPRGETTEITLPKNIKHFYFIFDESGKLWKESKHYVIVRNKDDIDKKLIVFFNNIIKMILS